MATGHEQLKVFATAELEVNSNQKVQSITFLEIIFDFDFLFCFVFAIGLIGVGLFVPDVVLVGKHKQEPHGGRSF